MKVLGVIPARGGSKGVPRKNLRPLGGRPLIGWVLEAALEVSELDLLVVTTDDEEIADVSRDWGARVLMRPKELAADATPMRPVLIHAMETMEAETGSGPFDWVMCIQPTYPFITGNRIREVLDAGGNTKADSVTTLVASPFSRHPFNARVIEPDGLARLAFPREKALMPQKQNASPFFFFGNLVMTRRGTLYEGATIYGETTHPVVVEEWESLDIDTPVDFKFCEAAMKVFGRDRTG
ncbi:MAG: acylneuraminate cytidylyltransferase family protein [Desulfobacteraceae bacterium]|nr:MAG: acylneuraminate cytidylyltransferase family protein [Desulfobacteraceae bacterium]